MGIFMIQWMYLMPKILCFVLVRLMSYLFLLLFYILILSERENEYEIKNRCAENISHFSSSEIGPLNIGP